ncbi:MAG: polysaccharide biosynthesis C-terminal domain-containing protein [Oribacterium sp.]|nr:polysaccharide biosynthesis C-terminal domain-containing protein [Oribacterium sp.]
MTLNNNSGEQVLKQMYCRCAKYSYIGSMVLMINSVIDGMLIAHFLGSKATASFGLVMPAYSLINLVPILLRSSVQTKIGEYLGRGDTKSAKHSLFILMTAAVAASLPLFIMFTLFSGITMKMLSAGAEHSEDTLLMASGYMHYLSISVFPIMMSSVLHPTMQLDGDIKRSAFAIQVGTVVNISGDLINVLLFNGGMKGMAIATDLSCFAELFILLLHYRNKDCILKPVLDRTEKHRYLPLFSCGLPFMTRELIAFISGIFLNRLAFTLTGENGVSILCIGNTIWLFMLPAAMAVSSAGNTLGGVSVGEMDWRGTQYVYKLGIWYSIIYGGVLAAIFFISAMPLAVFCGVGNIESMNMTIMLLRCLSLSLPVTMMCQVMESYLNVTGRNKSAVCLSILEGGTVLLGLSWLMRKYYGIFGMWTAKLIAPVMIAFLGFTLIQITGKTHTEENCIEKSVSTKTGVSDFSEGIRQFCLRNKINSRCSNLAALCVEELACNTLQWGYNEGRSPEIDIRAAYDAGYVTVRIRDSGRQFDPLLYTRQFVVSDEDPLKNFGLRLVSELASEMRYSCIADCNIVLIRIK